MRTYLKSKIHHCFVTNKHLHYVGSVVIDKALMEKADIHEYEQVVICNTNNGNRWETYCIAGEAHSGTISVQGPGARLCENGDCLVIITYQFLATPPPSPTTILVNKNNQFKEFLHV